MPIEPAGVIQHGLKQPTTAMTNVISGSLTTLYSDRAILESSDGSFDVSEFADDGHCQLRCRTDVHSQIDTHWQGPGKGLSRSPENAWLDIEWEGERLEVVTITWNEFHVQRTKHWIIAERADVAERFFLAVCEWCHEVRGEVLVFGGGCWSKSAELYAAIRDSRFDNLVLPADQKEMIQRDFLQFLAAQETYRKYGVPWKRGVLLLGPPGNGKTHCVKALVNLLRIPCLYVTSFKSPYQHNEDGSIHAVFDRARKATPCVLVLEDLDSLLNDGNRSFFLNELDGFASNTGIITLATCNHPERLDASILERPSRFDMKYHFDLPADQERQSYTRLWNDSLQSELRIPADRLDEIVRLTDGFSYAYIKELFLSSVMRWISDQHAGGMIAVMETQVAALRRQMRSELDAKPAPAPVDAESTRSRHDGLPRQTRRD